MGSKSKIEWTSTINEDGTKTAGATWTPVRARRKDDGKIGVHCERISPGCKECYSATFNKRRLPNQGTGLDFTIPNRERVEIFLDEKILTAPMRWRKPRKIFVCSQTDLFAEFVPFEFIDRVFAVMALCPQHCFQLLTKRPERMLEYFKDVDELPRSYFIELQMYEMAGDNDAWSIHKWPLPNCWLGVSVEDQPNADKRIPLLLQTPAAIRFVSYEPALSAVDFSPWIRACTLKSTHTCANRNHAPANLDWLICGGESGPGARPFDVQWARDVIRQCKTASVSCFTKQMGSNVQVRNDQVADVWYYADGSDMDTKEGPDHPQYQYQGELVTLKLKDRKGGDMAEWAEDLRVREFPQ